MYERMLLLAVLSVIALNVNAQTIKLINHYGKNLKVIVGRNPEVLPDFKKEFVLYENEERSSRFSINNKEAYLRAEDNIKNYGFFGVELRENNVNVHGYLSDGLAFSWDKGNITFCTPDEYKKHKSCE